MADVFTVCFSGTSCTRDEGEVSRPGSDKAIYDPATGYIPVRIHLEISGSLTRDEPQHDGARRRGERLGSAAQHQ